VRRPHGELSRGDEAHPESTDDGARIMMGWKSFNDRLALLLMIIIPLLWIFSVKLKLPDSVLGATIVT
jgi:hypothetical protein